MFIFFHMLPMSFKHWMLIPDSKFYLLQPEETRNLPRNEWNEMLGFRAPANHGRSNRKRGSCVSWTWGGSTAQVLQNDRESLGAAFAQSLRYFWMSSLHLLLLTSKLRMWNTTIICLESDMLQAQSRRLSGWPCSFADCSMLQQRPQPQTGSHPEPFGNTRKWKQIKDLMDGKSSINCSFAWIY